VALLGRGHPQIRHKPVLGHGILPLEHLSLRSFVATNVTDPEAVSRALLPMRMLDEAGASVHAGMMRTVILIASLLSIAPAIAQEAPSVWRDPEGGCTYLKLGDTLSLRYQRDGLPDCPDAGREAAPPDQTGSITHDDVQDVTRAIENLTRKLDDLRREYERRGRF
jgi:hypothetical protein